MTTTNQYPRLDAVCASIKAVYDIMPCAFTVGTKPNDKGTNLKSLTILAFAKHHNLSISDTLPMFGDAYDEVLADQLGTTHENIRALQRCKSLDEVIFHYDHPVITLTKNLQLIDDIWEDRTSLSPTNAPQDVCEAVENTVRWLDQGKLRVASKMGSVWITHQSIKKAILLFFKINGNTLMGDQPHNPGYDKVPLKFENFTDQMFVRLGSRVVPPATVRYGAYIGKNCILMPSYTNIGAYVDENTMVDTWATVGSCAQVGKNCHISGGAGIGGVLEPIQNNPTIIGNNCFIGARSEIVEGVIVEDNCVISMGVYIGQSTKIFNRTTGNITYGIVPTGSVVVPGTLSSVDGIYGLACAVIIKTVDEKTRAKTAINELLRD